MSVLFYRRPDYTKKPTEPLNSTECARYVERAKNSERAIPPGLSFEEVMANKSLPPCSREDFMDYLVYIEYNAENLQFFLWYNDYVKRFDALPEKKKVLSPIWNPATKEVPDLTADVEREGKRKEKRDTVANIMETGYDVKSSTAVMFSDELKSPPMSPVPFSGSLIAPSVTESQRTSTEASSQAGVKWQPFTIQPMREEINRIMRHYITFNASRELNLSHKDRALCLHALQHTTHPSALKPAVTIVEAALRGQSHPNFIRWSICNGNKPRVFFVRTMGVSNILFGFLIAILMTLSSISRWWRIFAAIEWFIGISTMVAAYKGLCVILHHSHSRSLRPWEDATSDSEMGIGRDSFASSENRYVQMASRTGYHEDIKDGGDRASFRSSSYTTFGPRNSFDGASWVEKYSKEPLLKKVFGKSTWTQDETLRLLQDKIVLGANLWAVIVTIPLTAIFVALPKGNLF